MVAMSESPLFSPLQAGDPPLLGGYRILARLGAGGMGRVYLGATASGRRLAVKVVRSEYAEEPEFRKRFGREIDAALRVRGPFTAALVDADADGDPPWLATEYVPGPSLSAAVATHGPLPESCVRTLVAGIAEALHAVHRVGLVHRDLKPSNVLLGPEGPSVIDFGIARAVDATPLTRSGLSMGTPMFMAPEQARGEETGPPADIWALGALAHYAATGRRPFGDGPDSAVLYRVVHEQPDITGCPGYLRPLVEGCLQKDPARRPELAEIRAAHPAGRPAPDWLPADLLSAAARYADTPPGPVYVHVPPVSGAPTLPPPSSVLPSVPFPVPSPASSPVPPAAAYASTHVPARATRPRRGRLAAGIVSFGVVLLGAAVATTLLLQPDDPPDTATPPSGDGLPGAAPAPGTYDLDEHLADVQGFRLTLTEIEVADDGTMTARVDYRNEGSGQTLGCLAATDPGASSVEYADGSESTSTETYCSAHPTATLTVAAGDTFTSYAVFPAPESRPFTLHWQPGQDFSGTASDLVLE